MSRRKGRLAAAGFRRVPNEPARRYIDPSGTEVSYREAFRRATHRSLEAASRAHAGKYERTTSVAKDIRTAAREGRLSSLKLLTPREERRLARRSIKSLMRGHTFKSALARGTSTARTEGRSTVERRTSYGRLLGVLHEGESGRGFRRRKGESRDRFRVRLAAWNDERRALRLNNPKKYRRLFGANSRKARLLVAMGRREASATYDVGETP